ncbi:MAG: glycogen-binding domain-containing protein [Gemmatimonadales bacterium]
MITHRIAPALMLLLAGLAWDLDAQVSAALDMGAGSYRPDRAISGGVASVAPTVWLGTGAFQWTGSGVYSNAQGGRRNFQGSSQAALHTPNLGIFRAELLGEVDWTWHHQVAGSAALAGELRGYVAPTPGSVLWIGQARGSAWSLNQRRPLVRSTVGTSARLGRIRVGVTLANTSFELLRGSEGSARDSALTTGTDTLKLEPRTVFTDAMISGHWQLSAVDLDASLGRRFSRTTPQITLWDVTAVRNLAGPLALLVSTGRSGSNPVTALPGSRYLVMGLRVRLSGTSHAVVELPRAPEQTALRIGPSRITGREVLLRAPGAHTVELAGDFTDWRPVELAPAVGSEWRVVLPIVPGLHRLAIRIDSRTWQAPPGTRRVTSEFGSEVGEVAVE